VLRWLTAGESHGPALVAVLEGLPAGVEITSKEIADQLARRRLGYGRGARMKFEQDVVTLLGGVRHGLTIGAPIAIQVGNTEWPKWEQIMSADPVDADILAGLARNAPLTRPRPGHADLAGMQKYGFDDARAVLERASARETAARVALGTLAQHFLRQTVGAEVVSHVVAIGEADAVDGLLPTPADREAIDASPTRSLDPESTRLMSEAIDACKEDGDTLGGVVEVLVYGLPPGLGSYVHGDRRLDARLAGALMSIQAIKGVEVGDGFRTARRRGSAAHDEIDPVDGPHGRSVQRRSNRAGGIEGGMTNGEIVRVRAAMKPISTVPRALATVDVTTGEAAVAQHQRSDVCAVPAAGVVAEAMVALVVAEAVVEKFGGDSVAETSRNVRGYLAALPGTAPLTG
jgi:chorismate synthase